MVEEAKEEDVQNTKKKGFLAKLKERFIKPKAEKEEKPAEEEVEVEEEKEE